MGGVTGHNRGIVKESEHSIIDKNLSILCTGLLLPHDTKREERGERREEGEGGERREEGTERREEGGGRWEEGVRKEEGGGRSE